MSDGREVVRGGVVGARSLQAEMALLRALFEECVDATPEAREERLARARREGAPAALVAQAERLLRIAAEEARLERVAERRRRWRVAGMGLLVATGVAAVAVAGMVLVDRFGRGGSARGGLGEWRRYQLPTAVESSLPAPWLVADGGNGHWYQFIAFGPIEEHEPEAVAKRARRQGARVARAGSPAEVRFLLGLAGRSDAADDVEPAAALARLELAGFFLEWSGDCDGDGRVDYGEIRSGDELDANGNGVPDRCE